MATEPRSRAIERGEPIGFLDVPGFVVLLDKDLNEVTPREDCVFDWELIPGGARYYVKGIHTFEIAGKEVSFQAVGARGPKGDGTDLMFVSIIASRPVEGPVQITVGLGTA